MRKVIVAYVPVLHRGYREFLERHPDVECAYVLGEDVLSEFDYLYRKDIRALSPYEAAGALRSLGILRLVAPADREMLGIMNKAGASVTMPDEDVSREVAKRHLYQCSVEFDSVFLRRDRKRTEGRMPVSPDVVISREELHRELMAQAEEIARHSPDWWYHVGALASRNGEVLLTAFNSYVPSPHIAYAFGDPRIHFKAGVRFELTQALHAEAAVVCEAARRAISLAGADLYTTMFPCPWCAKMIAYAGIKRLFFREGYSLLDGESILRSQGVQIIRVE